MGRLSSILRAALPAAAAARTGYLAGEDAGRKEREAMARMESERAEAQRTAAAGAARQSRLDTMKERVDESAIRENEAQAEKARREPAVGAKPPKMLNTDQGFKQWDSATGSWKSTGMRAKSSGADARRAKSDDRADARARGESTRAALGGVGRQIDDTQNEMRGVSSDFTLDDTQIKDRTTGLKSRLDSLTRVSDSLNTEVQKQSRPASGGSVPAALRSALPSMTARTETSAAAKADSASAKEKYERAIKAGAPFAEAKAAYDASLARITKKHGRSK